MSLLPAGRPAGLQHCLWGREGVQCHVWRPAALLLGIYSRHPPPLDGLPWLTQEALPVFVLGVICDCWPHIVHPLVYAAAGMAISSCSH